MSEQYIHTMTLEQRRNRLTTHFSERIPVVKRHISVIREVAVDFNADYVLSNPFNISRTVSCYRDVFLFKDACRY